MSPAPTTKPILTELITKLKNTRDFKSTLKQFKDFIDKKDRLPQATCSYFLYYDLDELAYKMASELQIPHNSLVLVKGVVPSKKDLKLDKVIEDYPYNWCGKRS